MRRTTSTSSVSCSAQSTYAPPRFHFAHDRARDLSGLVHRIATLAGLSPQDWQDDVFADLSALDDDGKFVHNRVGLSIPRQVGKSHLLIAWVVVLVLLGYTVLWTDHNYSTTCEMLKRFREIFGTRPNDRTAKHKNFNKRVTKVNNKTAQEAFFFDSGGSLHFATRTKSASLGYSFDVVIYDEAQELTNEHMQIIVPTTAAGAKKNPQSIYAGTPTRAGSVATVFQDMRDEFVESDEVPPRACWWEWGVEDRFDVRDDDLVCKMLPLVNPSLGRTANEVSIIVGIAQVKDDVAALQEYFGFWLSRAGVAQTMFSRSEWESLQVLRPMTDGQRNIGIKFSVDGEHVAVCISVYKSGHPVFVDGVFDRSTRGKRWLVEWICERKDSFGWISIDGKSGAQDLYEKLVDAGVQKSKLHLMTTQDMISACSGFETAIAERSVAHVGQEQLADSVCGCVKRLIGNSGGWGFGSSEFAVSTLVESAAVAVWSALNTPHRYDREARIG